MSSKISSMISNTVMGVLSVVIFVLIGIALGPTLIAAAANINATSVMVNYPLDNTTIPLGSIIVLLATYLPTFYYLALVLGGMIGIWAAVKFTS